MNDAHRRFKGSKREMGLGELSPERQKMIARRLKHAIHELDALRK